jgi:hypothetical protein
MELKHQIEQLYINALYNDEAPNNFANKLLSLIGADEKKLTRSQLQSRARWRYLNLVASILNDSGKSLEIEGLEIPVRWNKDLLYHMHWQTSREIIFPGKKKQLNTAEFSKLSDHVLDLFAMIFDIHIPFPNIKDKLREQDDKANL